MACRRLLTTLKRHTSISLLSSPSISTHSSQSVKTLVTSLPSLPNLPPKFQFYPLQFRLFSSKPPQNPKTNPARIEIDDVDDDDDDDDEEDYSSAEEEEIDGNVGKRSVNEPSRFEERSYYVADYPDIGYEVIGSNQFKVRNGDRIYVEKIKHCDLYEMQNLYKVMMVCSPTQTINGRPILPEAEVHADVEEYLSLVFPIFLRGYVVLDFVGINVLVPFSRSFAYTLDAYELWTKN
ncbi:hypothetical protein KSS87_013592 [Heliosperma pusillum]|nr:hypothetical protein KSS87_013592 [Heliosperma pusillum]